MKDKVLIKRIAVFYLLKNSKIFYNFAFIYDDDIPATFTALTAFSGDLHIRGKENSID